MECVGGPCHYGSKAQIATAETRIREVGVRIYYIYYLLRSNAADGQRTADG
jgi:hypothetical protein